MIIRQLINFNGSLGLIIPHAICEFLELKSKDHVEIFFVTPDKIIIKKLESKKSEGVTTNG